MVSIMPTTHATPNDLLWPPAAGPSFLDDIERTPLEERGLPESMYEGNNVELQVDNFGDWAKSKQWMQTSAEFKANPIGQFVDPEKVAARPCRGDAIRGDPRQGDGRRLRPRAGPRRDPGDVMRLCRDDAGRGPRPGIVEDGHVVDREDAAERHPLDEVRLLAPVLPRKFLAIGLNYADHISESGMEARQFPVFFNKQVTCVVGPDDDVHMPRVSNLLDYEGELAVVIGTRCRHVSAERIQEVIAGYTIANDVSVPDWQLRTPTMTMGKSFDTHGPLGPWVVTADELGDPHDLDIKTYVNDGLRQDGNTGEMIYDCWEQVAHLSQAFTLEPGDVIATGTPVGIGAVRQPFPEGLLNVGDVMRVQIAGIGELVNTVVAEPEGYLAPESEPETAWVP
jgi:2-keto-4-pentenoate hydratase/2-oxohepta-3-ene-1,7-dioic acid hydratase in catechol pathway